jgi:outer membrane receptor protein involved in Fe transport
MCTVSSWRKTLRNVILAGLACAPRDRAAAQEPGHQGSRYVAVVTASRQQSTVFDSPRAASAVTRATLRRRVPRTTAEALNETEGVFIQQTGYSGGSAFVRGLTGQHLLLMVDGVRLNTTITRTGPNGLLTLIDPYIVESVEVVRGPGSVLYGSDAVGGVVQVHTRHPRPRAGSPPSFGARLRGIYSSFDQALQGSVSAHGEWGRLALDGAFSARRFGDLRGGSAAPEQPMTGYHEGGLYLGAGLDLGPGRLIAAYHGVRQLDAMRNDRSQPGDLRAIPEMARDLVYLRYTGSHGAARPVAVSATVSYQRQREVQDRLRVALDRRDRDDNSVDVFGLTAFARVPAGRLGALTAGVDGAFEWVTSLSLRGPIGAGPEAPLMPQPELARYPAGSSAQAIALFVQDEVDLMRLAGRPDPDLPGRLRALLGLRVGGSFLTIGRDDRLTRLFPRLGPDGTREARLEANPVYAGSLHLRYAPLPGLALSGGFMTGYRAPNLADYARLGPEGLGYAVPAADLHPEVSYAGEAGVRAAFQRVEGSAFYAFTLIDGVMAAAPTQVAGQACSRPGPAGGCEERFYGRENADQARFHSVEALGRLHLVAGLSLLATLSYVHGTLDRAASSKPFYKVPPLNGVAALQLHRQQGTYFAELSLRWAAPQERLGDADLDDPRVCVPGQPCAGTPGFAVLSLRGAARLTSYLFLTAAVENLTNATYRYHGSGIDGPGIGARVSIEATY